MQYFIKCSPLLISSTLLTLLIAYHSYNYSSNEAIQDAHAIYHIMEENHPAIYNTSDQAFQINFKEGFKKTLITLKSVQNYEEGFLCLEKWINAFDDPHLRIRKIIPAKYAHTNNTNQNTQTKNSFYRDQWTSNTVYIKIPTFHLSLKNQDQLKKVITVKPTIRKAKNIIFDLRENEGGSSLWGIKIANALFGPEYMKQRRYLYEKDTEVNWRASKDNLAYINNIIPTIKNQFGKDSPEHQLVTTICNGLKEAITNNKPFFTLKCKDLYNSATVTQQTHSLCNAHIFILIDGKCASATLSFIDELTSTENRCTLIGTKTAYDTEYMECRSEELPSRKARLVFPIKMYRNRYRKSRQSYMPDIVCDLSEKSYPELKEWFLKEVLTINYV